MGDPEDTATDNTVPTAPAVVQVPGEISGAPLTNPKPDDIPAPVTDPTIPELQDRRRPK